MTYSSGKTGKWKANQLESQVPHDRTYTPPPSLSIAGLGGRPILPFGTLGKFVKCNFARGLWILGIVMGRERVNEMRPSARRASGRRKENGGEGW